MPSSYSMTTSEAEALLGLTGAYDEAALKHAFRSHIKKHHPDRFENADEGTRKREADFATRINEAHDVLKEKLERNGGHAQAAPSWSSGSAAPSSNAASSSTASGAQTGTKTSDDESHEYYKNYWSYPHPEASSQNGVGSQNSTAHSHNAAHQNNTASQYHAEAEGVRADAYAHNEAYSEAGAPNQAHQQTYANGNAQAPDYERAASAQNEAQNAAAAIPHSKAYRTAERFPYGIALFAFAFILYLFLYGTGFIYLPDLWPGILPDSVTMPVIIAWGGVIFPVLTINLFAKFITKPLRRLILALIQREEHGKAGL